MIDHDGVEHAGYMSFMLLVSIFPFFTFMLAFTSFFGASELGEKFIQIAVDTIPEHSADLVKFRINELTKSPPQSLLTIAIIGLIWTSSSFVECIRTILNRVYNVSSPPHYVFRRMLSIVQFFVISAIISFAMFIFIIVPIGLGKIPQFVDYTKDYVNILNFIRYTTIFLCLFLSVCALYCAIPNMKVKFSNVIPGALLTVIFWFASARILSKYISYYNQFDIIYGSLGSIIITLVFFYIVNMIFIIGAEFNYLNSKKI